MNYSNNVDPEPGSSNSITITKTFIIIPPDELIDCDIEIYVFPPGPVIDVGKPLRPGQFFGNLQPPTDRILFYYTLKRPSPSGIQHLRTCIKAYYASVMILFFH